MQQNSTVETLIGAVVVAVAAGFLFFAYTSTSSGGLSGYDLTASMSGVDGVARGTDVRIAGIKVGTVTDLKLDPVRYLVVMRISINPDVKIPEDSSLIITQPQVIGSTYVQIQPGGSDKMLMAGGRIRTTQGSVNMQGIIGQALDKGGAQPAQK